jgi:DNA invertase Pin-like site-specific DNA recombinase
MLNMLAAFAEVERELIVERTLAGLARARRQGRVGGRPRVVCDRTKVERLRKTGVSFAAIAKQAGISKSSVHRIAGS